MKLIIKGNEPAEWKAYRETEGVKYNAIPELRKALYDEQGGICAYCMQKLIDEHYDEHGLISNAKYIGDPKKLERVTNKIEHIKCREREEYKEFIFDYNNMVMCCCGVAYNNFHKKSEHCDTSKGCKDISFTPLNPNFIETISYGKDGAITSSDDTYKKEFNNILNLNEPMLQEYRGRIYYAINKKIVGRQWTASKIRTLLQYWASKDQENLFKPFCGLVISFLEKKMIANGIKI